MRSTEPSPSLEIQLIALWRHILGDPVSVDDDFFAMGGDSITAMRMLGRAADIVGARIPFGTFRAAPTIGGLIACAQTGHFPAAVVAGQVDTTGGDDAAFALSKQQLAALFAHHVAPDSRAYLAESSTYFIGPLDKEALKSSLLEIFRRHDIYRTTFDQNDGIPMQIVKADPVLHFDELNAPDVTADDEHAFVQQQFDARMPLISDIGTLPLCTFLLIQFSAQRHVLLHREHHLIHDGWSSSEFTRELIALYREKTEIGYSAALAAPGRFRDFVRYQAEWLQSDAAAAQLGYWRGQLEHTSGGVSLFGRDTRMLTYRGNHMRTTFTRAEWQQFESAAHSLGVTTYTLFTALMLVCLWRFSGQQNLALGSAFAARNWPASDRTLGMFVNTVVLVQSIRPDMSVADLLCAVDHTVQGAIAHQEYPYLSLVEELGSGTRHEGDPFANIMLGFHDTPIDMDPPANLTIYKDETIHSDSSKYDLTALVVHRAQHSNPDQIVNILWEYRDEIFERWEIACFTDGVAGLVRAFAKAGAALKDVRVDDLTIVTADRNIWLTNAAQGAIRPDLFANSVDVSVLAFAAITPDATALEDPSTSITYAELFDQVDALSSAIDVYTRDRTGPIGITYPRNTALVVAMLAAMRAQVPFVILDTELPSARLDYIAQDAGIVMLIGPTEQLAEHSFLATMPAIKVGAMPDGPGREGRNADARGADNDPLAYIAYTSGSTGHPKGVEVPQSALANVTHWLAEEFDMDQSTVATAVVYPAFDAFMSEVWPPLIAGGTLVLLTDDIKHDLRSYAALLADRAVTSTFLPTGLFREFCTGGYPWPASLRTISTGGEALPDMMLPEGFKGRAYDLYGPTETTVLSTAARYDQSGTHAPSIGRPIANTCVSVVDSAGRPVPPGVPGELLISGVGVARGYRGLADETAKRFSTDIATGIRTYRTGDLVRWGADGQLKFEGRLDEELKVRGFRIAPQEIIGILELDQSVAQAIAIAKNGNLIAYIVRNDAADPNRPADGALCRSLRRDLKQKLPLSMIPQAIVVLDRIPLTSRGKVDKNALPSPLHRAGKSARAPSSPIEIALCQIWEDVLDQSVPSAEINFFTLGGHSIQAMRVIALVQDRFGLTLAMRDFYRNGTIEAQARCIEATPQNKADDGSHIVEEGMI